MNDWIKEILESLDKIAKAEYYPEDLLTYKECQLLLDYITNLQNKYENQIHRYMNLKEQTINLQKEKDTSVDYARHLHNENKKLQEENKKLTFRVKELKYFNDILEQKEIERLKEIKKLQEELEITQEKWDKDKQWSECRTKEWLDYKSRCERAIEYIEDNTYKSYETDYMDLTGIKELLSILNGGDEDEENKKRN